jgi:hypothetical protein
LFSNKQIFTSGLGCVVFPRKRATLLQLPPPLFPSGGAQNSRGKKKKEPHFDALKNPKNTFHYPSSSFKRPRATSETQRFRGRANAHRFFSCKSRTPDLASSRKRATCSSCPLPSHLFPSGGAQNRREKRPHFDPQNPQRLLSLPR